MKTDAISGSIVRSDETGTSPDSDRLENMKELLADLHTSIQTQRHLITISRELLDRS